MQDFQCANGTSSRQARTIGYPTSLPTPRLLPLPCRDHGVPGISTRSLSPRLCFPVLKPPGWVMPPGEGACAPHPSPSLFSVGQASSQQSLCLLLGFCPSFYPSKPCQTFPLCLEGMPAPTPHLPEAPVVSSKWGAEPACPMPAFQALCLP